VREAERANDRFNYRIGVIEADTKAGNVVVFRVVRKS